MSRYTIFDRQDRIDLYTDSYLHPEKEPPNPSSSVANMVMTFIAYIFAVFTFPVSVFCCVKIIQDYERAVVFRLGRLQPLKEPGVIIVLPCIDICHRVDMRIKAFNVPPQKIITKDQAAVLVGADIQFVIKDPIAYKGVIQDLNHSLRVLAQTTLVNTMMLQKLVEIQTDKRFIEIHAKDRLDKAIRSWGVQIHRIEISEPQVICPPPEFKPDFASLFKSSDNPINTLFQVMQGATGMMPQAFPQPTTQSQPTQQCASIQSQAHQTLRLDPSQLVTLFNHITDERLVQDVGCVYQFNIGQDDTWYMDLKNGCGHAGKGPPTVCPPDAVISLSPEDLQALFSGAVTPFNAYMQGKVTIVGDVRLAMKLQSVVYRLKQPRASAKTTHARGDVITV